MQQGVGYMPLNGTTGNPQLPRHLRMVEATELIQQKCLAHGGLQPFEKLRDALQGLQGLVANLRRRMARLGQQRQGFEIRALQRIAPPVIDH